MIVTAEPVRSVSVAPERLAGWIARFTGNHGDLSVVVSATEVVLDAPDGASARIEVPFPPLVFTPADVVADLVRHVRTARRIGVLLVRRRGHAAGIFLGRELISSKVGSTYVQGTTKAGGWSQQRYARRRANQTKAAYEDAAADAAMILVPEAGLLDALITGGDKVGVSAVLADERLAGLKDLVSPRWLNVPDPRLRVLAGLSDQLLAVSIELNALA